MVNPGDDVLAEETELSGIEDNGVSNLSFQQRLEIQERQLAMLDLKRKTKLEEREAEREGWEYERQKAREEKDRMIREEERLRTLRKEKEEIAIRHTERQLSSSKRP